VNSRLISLDFFRGLTIAAMIVVNDPGSWSYIYAPLKHADWHGATPTDLVFPFFLFIVGVSISLSLSKRKVSGNLYFKIVKRSIIIFLLGIFLALFPSFDFENLRIVGVLQRIAIVYLVCAVLYLNTSFSTQLKIGIGLLIVYWITMMFVPFSGNLAGTLEPGNNFAAWVDSFIVPGRMYQETWDPEGFYSTIPSIATGITGMLCGKMILNTNNSLKDKIIKLFYWGILILIAGHFWDYIFPINKHIWTSSYVLFSSGLGMIILAMSMWIIDEKKHTSNIKFGLVFGSNAIVAYVLHGIVWRLFQIPIISGVGLQKLWMDTGINLGLPAKFVSLDWAVFYTVVIYFIVYQLYKKKIFIKI
jgi:predicted acyltransferase